MKWKTLSKRMLAVFLAAVMLAGVLPLQSLAVPNGSTINVEVGKSFSDFAGSIPQRVLSCARCGGDLYTTTPQTRNEYLNPTISSSNEGIVTNLSYSFGNTTITSDPSRTYEAIKLNFTGAKAGTTTITVSYTIHFQIPNFGNGNYECSDCGYPVRYYGYDGYDTITRTFTVNVTEPTPVETTYTLTYDGNGEGVTGVPATDTYTGTEDSHTFTVSGSAPTREGYTFKGWAATPEGTDPLESITATKENPSVGVFAIWEEKTPAATYTVTYTDGVEEEEIFPDQVYSNLAADTATPAFDGTPTREGYTFAGWDPAVAETVTGDATYTAQWTKKTTLNTFQIDYKKNTEDSTVDNMPGGQSTMTSDSQATLTITSKEPTRTGYIFRGWAGSEEGEVIYIKGDQVTLTLDNPRITLYAVWEAEAPHEHEWTYTDNGDGTHTGHCSGCDETDGPDDHTWDKGKVTKAVTLTEAGKKTYTCIVCGATKDEGIPVPAPITNEIVEHENQPGFIYVLENSAKAGKKPAYIGNINDDTSGRQVVSRRPIAGTYTIGEPYEENGKFYCKVTITDLQPYLDAFSEKYPGVTYKIDTANSPASYTYVLEYIGYDYPNDPCSWRMRKCEETTNRLWITHEHYTTGQWNVTKEATCTEDGERSAVCAHCYKLKPSTISSYNCKETFTETIPATDHDWDEGVVTRKPTTTVPGEILYTCKNDPNHTKTEEIPVVKQETVRVLVYRNGNTETPYATFSLDGYAKGDTLDVSTLNIADYYSGTAKFEGWYNDGGWNTYKKGNPNQTISEPLTINGWTNLYCMVTDYENVSVYGVFDGDKANAQRIYFGKALHGSDLNAFLEENVTGLEKEGYTLDKWYNWDWYGHKIGESATVNGWTNVYVTYTANEYTVSFDANGGTPEAEPITVTYGKAYGELPQVSRTNYDFGGWALENGTVVTADTLVSVAGDHTLKAVWTVAQPKAPGSSTTNTSKTLFTIQCDTVEEHKHVSNWFGSHVTYVKDSLTWDADRGVWTCQAKINLSIYNTSTIRNKSFGGINHKYTGTYNGTTYTQYPIINLVWDPDVTGENSQGNEVTGLWVGDGEQIVHNYCYPKPAAPSAATVEKLDKIIWVHENYKLPENGAAAGSRYLTSRKLIAGTYSIGEMYQEGSDFYCKLTITDLDPYIQAFNAQFATDTESYVVDTVNSPASYEYVLKYTGSKTDYKQDGTGWTIDASSYANNAEKLNGKNLWMVHTPHNYGEWETVREATCIEDGERIRKCTHNATDKTRYCTATETEVIPATGHDLTHVEAVAPTCEEDGNIEYWYCANCGKYFTDAECTQEVTVEETILPAIGHAWNVVGKVDATCTTPEYTTYQCGNDPHHIKQEVSGEALGHDYKTVVTEPTCTKGGYTTYTCERCGESHMDDFTDPTGHSWDEGTVITDAGCAEDGVMEYTCTVCGEKKQENIGATGHTFVETKHEPTCTECGWITHTCSVCGYSYDSDHVAALGHKYEETVVAPTCTGVGYTQYTCSECGHSYTDKIVQPTGHSYETKVDEATCTEGGKTWEVCSVCGDKRLIDTAPALGHDFSDEWTEDVKPTCTEPGSKSRHCSRCDEKTDITVIPATGHDWDEGVVTKEATTAHPGEKTYTCKNDPSHTYTEEIPQLTPDLPTESYLSTMQRGYVIRTVENWNVLADGTPGTQKVSSSPRDFKFNAIPGTYTLSEVEKKDGSFYCTLTITDLTPYVDGFLEEYETSSEKYAMDTENTKADAFVYTLKWNNYSWQYVEDGFNAAAGKNLYMYHTKHTSSDKEWTIAKEATCEEDGLKTMRCSHLAGGRQNSTRCAALISEVIPATGHTWGEWTVTTPATCTEDGVKTRTCTDCGKEETEAIAATGHDWDEGKVTKAATCTEEGVKTFTCKNDSTHTRTESIAATGHTASDWKHNSGSHWQVCTECGETIEGTKGNHVDKDSNNKCDVCGVKLAKVDSNGNPKTGDTAPVALMVTVLLISAAGICLVVLYFVRKKSRR